MEIECPKCHRTFHIGQKHRYHAGFGDVGFLYCDRCPNLVVFSAFDPVYEDIVGSVNPWMLNFFQKWKVERQLERCSCGGRFRFGAEPRCPLCNVEIPSILSDSIHYIETGKCFDGARDRIWKAPMPEGEKTRRD
jgi:hypothetical protein